MNVYVSLIPLLGESRCVYMSLSAVIVHFWGLLVIRLIGWLLVDRSFLAHVLVYKIVGLVFDRLRASHRYASSLAAAQFFGCYVVAQLESSLKEQFIRGSTNF